jgi:hypothetical protein
VYAESSDGEPSGGGAGGAHGGEVGYAGIGRAGAESYGIWVVMAKALLGSGSVALPAARSIDRTFAYLRLVSGCSFAS